MYGQTYQAYAIYRSVYYDNTDKNKAIKLVTNISSHTLYDSGDGSEENPYIIKYNGEE